MRTIPATMAKEDPKMRKQKRTQKCGVLLILLCASLALNMIYQGPSNAWIQTKGFDEQQVAVAVATLFNNRFKMYRDRYRYSPPLPYINHAARKEICGSAPDFGTYFRRSSLERSANFEDSTIYELLFKNKNTTGSIGSIVEMGAFDGIRESNSRFFDACLGWNTLLIEGSPSLYDKLLVNRPHAHRFNYVPCCTEEEELSKKTLTFEDVPFTNGGLADGHGAVETAYTRQNLTRKVDVPCGSLTKVLLDVFPNGHVSLFSLDVEGSEPLVVGNIDFDRVYIETMIIENRNEYCKLECASRDAYRKIMKDAGYILFDKIVTKSDLFIHPLSKHLKTLKKMGHLPRELAGNNTE